MEGLGCRFFLISFCRSEEVEKCGSVEGRNGIIIEGERRRAKGGVWVLK